MPTRKKIVAAGLSTGILCAVSAIAADLSPANWPVERRLSAEQKEDLGWLADSSRNVTGKNGLISATCSPIAVEAGMQALQQGGSAADAAATVALTQCTVQLGSVVSYAGVMSMLYYDAASKKVFSLDGGYNTCINEKDSPSIPGSNLGNLDSYKPATASSAGKVAHGRKVLVPGFMAGIEAMHKRFGRLSFESVFQPAIWYAENGVKLGDYLSGYLAFRKQCLERTESGRNFIKQSGSDSPKKGDLFKQLELADLLRNVSKQGASYMYTGPWAKHFVAAVKRDGGKMQLKDLASYQVIWSEPVSADYMNHTVYLPASPNECARQMIPALNMAEALKFDKRANYWADAAVLRDYQRIFDLTDLLPYIEPSVLELLKGKNIDVSPQGQLSKEFAAAVMPLLDQIATLKNVEPHHSDSIVVVDSEGNIAALTHSINTVIWGDTGIVVDGVPVPDSANFQQEKLAGIKPGGRLTHEQPQAIVFKDGQPVFACAAIGSSLVQETTKTIIGLLGKGSSLSEIQASPPLIFNFMELIKFGSILKRGIVIPEGVYDESFVKALTEMCKRVTQLPPIEIAGLRGTVSTVLIDAKSGELKSTETENMLLHSAAY